MTEYVPREFSELALIRLVLFWLLLEIEQGKMMELSILSILKKRTFSFFSDFSFSQFFYKFSQNREINHNAKINQKITKLVQNQKVINKTKSKALKKQKWVVDQQNKYIQ